jgi:DNA repair exonuclease SbcCD ATPase subunit
MAKDPELDRLGAERDRAREAKDQVKRQLDDAWNELERLQLRYGAKIERLKDDHDSLFENMKEAQREAARCYHMGQHDIVRYWKEKAAEYQSMMPGVVEERRALIAELESARNNHRALRDEYRPLKERYNGARDRFQKRLEQLKAENEFQRKQRLWESP